MNSDSGGSGIESMKKLSGKKRKRILADIDIDEYMFKTNDYDESDDYLFGNTKKRETRSSAHNLNGKNENISVDIELIEETNLKRNKRKKI